jgi:HEPN domain-containing protein
MPHERRPPDDPREWINRARSNLVRAQVILPGVYLENLCFDAQQAAEKAIKAVLIARGAVFPPTHDLAGLLTILGQNDEAIPSAIADAARLTRFAVTTRYPGVTDPLTAEEHHRAVAIAKAVVE